MTWRILDQTLIVGRYDALSQKDISRPVKVAAFDLDDTLITPKQGSRYARSGTSWKWWDTLVPSKLKQLYDDGYLVVIFSNQGSIKTTDDKKIPAKDSLSLRNFKDQASAILRQLDFPLSLYAASGPDRYRKPRTGMWEQLRRDYDLQASDAIDVEASFYVGDAAGREKTDKRNKDHANSDRDLAANIGIHFHTPEEFFLGHEIAPYVQPFDPRKFLKSASSTMEAPSEMYKKRNVQELVVFCGSPGAGKSSFYWKMLQPQGFERVNQDILKTRERCLKVARGHLEQGLSVAVDNTNRDRQARAHWVKMAREFRVPIRCVYFTATARLCEHNDTVRAHNGSVRTTPSCSYLACCSPAHVSRCLRLLQ